MPVPPLAVLVAPVAHAVLAAFALLAAHAVLAAFALLAALALLAAFVMLAVRGVLPVLARACGACGSLWCLRELVVLAAHAVLAVPAGPHFYTRVQK